MDGRRDTDSGGAPNPDRGACLLPPDVREALRRGFEDGERRWGPLGLDFDAFADDVQALVAARRARLGLPHGPDDCAAALPALALADLCLARACERGSQDGWRALTTEFAPRLQRFVARRGVRGADAEALATGLLADLALPAAGARTLLGTYAGSGALWAWLAATTLRRIARRVEERGHASAAAREVATSTPPWARAVEAETARGLDAALREAWGALEAPERACLLLKHRHGVAQRRIAEMLGVPESQVSRWIARAVTKIRGAVERRAGSVSETEPTDSLWARLREVVEVDLASFEAQCPPILPGEPEPGSPPQ